MFTSFVTIIGDLQVPGSPGASGVHVDGKGGPARTAAPTAPSHQRSPRRRTQGRRAPAAVAPAAVVILLAMQRNMMSGFDIHMISKFQIA